MDFEKLHREESGRILATLIGLLGDFDLAEEMLQEAYAVALQKWPSDGTPANPRAWLISTARHKAIDRLRRDQRFERKSEEFRDRLDGVLLVVYLIFNEGYLASSGDALIRRELCAEAIRLGRVLCGLLPKQAEVQALLGLMLLQDSRRDARVSAEGELVLLEEQDRGLWHGEQIQEGTELVKSALRRGASGAYALQASIAALHANAKTAKDTDWPQIAALYDALLRMHTSPVIEVNRAVAVAMARSVEEGLALLDELERREELEEFHLLPAARANLLRRLERMGEAANAYRRALSPPTNELDRRFLRRRLTELEKLRDLRS